MDPDRHPLDLLSAILGEGMASRLFLQLREDQGLVYDVGTSVSKLKDTGSMTIYAGTEPKNAPKAIRGIIDELSRVSNDLKESELNRARELLKGRLLLGLEDTRGISSWLGYQETLMDQIYTPEDVVKSLDSVTVEDIKRVASKLFRNDLYRLAVVGPFRSEKRFQKILENIG
jgi:predicted Zn-dependent peptidase